MFVLVVAPVSASHAARQGIAPKSVGRRSAAEMCLGRVAKSCVTVRNAGEDLWSFQAFRVSIARQIARTRIGQTRPVLQIQIGVEAESK